MTARLRSLIFTAALVTVVAAEFGQTVGAPLRRVVLLQLGDEYLTVDPFEASGTILLLDGRMRRLAAIQQVD